jgi:nitrous-oxide reductase
VNASQNDKDFIMAVNWKLAEQYAKEGKGKMVPGKYHNNSWTTRRTHMETSKIGTEVLQLDPKDLPDCSTSCPAPRARTAATWTPPANTSWVAASWPR